VRHPSPIANGHTEICRLGVSAEEQERERFSALRWSDFRPATLGHDERRIDEAFFFIQRAVFTKLVGNVRQNQTQNLFAAPSLKASMHSFVIRIALRQHVPLRTCVENPQHRFQHMTGEDRLASSTPVGNMLLRKMLPNALPLFVISVALTCRWRRSLQHRKRSVSYPDENGQSEAASVRTLPLYTQIDIKKSQSGVPNVFVQLGSIDAGRIDAGLRPRVSS
jgi:hypothetical protein